MGQMKIPTRDYAGQASTVTVNVANGITDPNFTLLHDAVMGLSKAKGGQSELITKADKDNQGGGNSADVDAARELKYIVNFTDDVNGEPGNFEIPAAEGSALVAGTELVDLTAGAGLTAKTEIEAHGLSRDGNAITVQTIQRVGRNL